MRAAGRVLSTILITILVGYAAICGLAFAFQDRLVWFPGDPPALDPSAMGLAFEETRIETPDGEQLHAWFIPGPGRTVLISHGNAGSIDARLPIAAAFRAMGHAVLLYDYRGYGLSTGRPSEEGTYLDAVAAFDWLAARGAEDIVAYGESLGGGVSIELALRRPVAALVVEETFTSLSEVGQRAYPFLPVRWLSRIRYDNLSKIARLKVPVMIIHSPDDQLVPFAQAEALGAAAGVPVLRTAGDHSTGGFLLRAEWRAAVGEFLAK